MPLKPSLRPVRAHSRSFKTSSKALGLTISQVLQRADQVIE